MIKKIFSFLHAQTAAAEPTLQPVPQFTACNVEFANVPDTIANPLCHTAVHQEGQ